MYASFLFYKETYQGVLQEAKYNHLVVRAAAEIDRMTTKRARTATGDELEAVKFAECAVVDELSYQALGGSGDVTSESNDGISRSYSTGATAKSSRQKIDAAAYPWLCDTSLLYVGI